MPRATVEDGTWNLSREENRSDSHDFLHGESRRYAPFSNPSGADADGILQTKNTGQHNKEQSFDQHHRRCEASGALSEGFLRPPDQAARDKECPAFNIDRADKNA